MTSKLHCPHHPACSGCSSIGIDYPDQLAAKLRLVRELFAQSPWRQFDAGSIQTIRGSPDPTAYRNRVKLVPRRKDGNIALGLFKARSHEVVDIPHCPVQTDGINAAVEVVRKAIDEQAVSIYDETAHRGDLRFVTVREGVRTGEILVGLVTMGEVFAQREQLTGYIMEHCEGAVGVVQNVNPEKGNVIFGRTNHLVAGREYLEEIVCGERIRLGVTSFFQVNTAVAEKAYERILDHVTGAVSTCEQQDARPDVTMLDLYSGVGTIGLAVARHVRQVHGIEESADAVGLGRAAARMNGMDNVLFRDGLVERDLPGLVDELRGQGVAADRLVAVVNPPRKGLGQTVVDQLTDAGPARIIYLSCAPHTLIRDLGRLENGGYRVVHVELFDMFPQTEQVETLAILDRWSRDGNRRQVGA
jgi:23S rRNA (uracil1939-C5)-methyltransferase